MATCPICDERVESRAKSPTFPFCSARCKTIDLGRWLSDVYRVPVDASHEDELELPSSAHDGA